MNSRVLNFSCFIRSSKERKTTAPIGFNYRCNWCPASPEATPRQAGSFDKLRKVSKRVEKYQKNGKKVRFFAHFLSIVGSSLFIVCGSWRVAAGGRRSNLKISYTTRLKALVSLGRTDTQSVFRDFFQAMFHNSDRLSQLLKKEHHPRIPPPPHQKSPYR